MTQLEQLVYNLLETNLNNLGQVVLLWMVLFILSLLVDFVMTYRFHKAVLAELKQDKNAISYLDI